MVEIQVKVVKRGSVTNYQKQQNDSFMTSKQGITWKIEFFEIDLKENISCSSYTEHVYQDKHS